MFIAQLLLFMGCTLLYLSHPNQQWRAKPLPPLARLGSGISMLLALACLERHYSLGSSLLIIITSVTLYLGLLPFGSLCRSLRNDKRRETTGSAIPQAPRTPLVTTLGGLQQPPQSPPQALHKTQPLPAAPSAQQHAGTTSHVSTH